MQQSGHSFIICRVQHGIDRVGARGGAFDAFYRRGDEIIKVLALFMQIVQRFKLQPALAQAGGGVNFAGAQDEPLGLFQRFQRAQGQLLARACAQGDDGYLMHDGFNPFSALRGGADGQADPRCARP